MFCMNTNMYINRKEYKNSVQLEIRWHLIPFTIIGKIQNLKSQHENSECYRNIKFSDYRFKESKNN